MTDTATATAPISMYQASSPVFLHMLKSLATILAKAAENAEARGIAPDVLASARLAPDMRPFYAQVQMATDSAKGAAARLSGVENPSFPDVETTFPELQERVAKTIAFVESVPADKIDGSEGREVVLKFPSGEHRFDGRSYLLNFALPNFMFHVTTAYAILRHNGVPLGKMDFLAGGR
jgi:uncharacterized protein